MKVTRKTDRSALTRGIKTIKLAENDYLHFWYANNRGRGTDNCTIIRSTCPNRANRSARQENVDIKCKTSSWAGNVNFSKSVQKQLNVYFLEG